MYSFFLIVLIVSSSFMMAYSFSSDLQPLISSQELTAIEWMQTREEKYAMSLHKYYSPWIIGWSGHETIAPGLFDADQWNLHNWTQFWNGNSSLKYEMIVSSYGNEVLIFQGTTVRVSDDHFANETFFEKVYKRNEVVIYKPR